MTVLAGRWCFSEQADRTGSAETVSAMIEAQYPSADQVTHASVLRSSGNVVLARSNGLPAPFGCEFAVAAADVDGLLIVADARIDNRRELLDRLGRSLDEAIDDESLFLLAYRHWGERCVDHVIGDFACAVWEARMGRLTLFRDPTGQRPLHYHFGNGFAAFASMPQGLLALTAIRSRPNTDRLARFIATLPQQGGESFFRDISRVEPAQIVRITQSGVHTERYWAMPTRDLRYRDPRDYVSAFREVLDRATADRMRGEPIVATHLSAGLDSGAITATAARVATHFGGRVLALTSAPRAGFSGPVPFGRIADESGLARELAASYSNIEHVVLRSAGRSSLELLERDALRFGQPVGYPCNNVWWHQANAVAKDHGARVVLTGEMGNLTISAGGLGVLADYLRAGRYLQWFNEVRALEKRGPRWRGLMAASFGPWIPRAVFEPLRRFAAGGRAGRIESLLTESWRERIVEEAARVERGQSRSSERETRWEMLSSSDPGTFRKAAWLASGIDERDPTADRRVAEFCFSLPPSQLLGNGETRRLARSALADRLPNSILDGPRGYQYADWYEALDRDGLSAMAKRIADSPVATEVVDIAAIERLIETWPPRDWASADTIGTYRVGLLRALSAGIFALKAEA